MPKRRPGRSAAQKAQLAGFKAARAYSLEVLADPLQHECYARLARERNRRLHPLLVSDYLTPPVVERIDLTLFAAQRLVRVIATDDIEVTAVEVKIHNGARQLLDHGPATKRHGLWCYPAAVPQTDTVLHITATARDRPGNEATLTVTYP